MSSSLSELDLKEQIARIDRAQEEGYKFVAEQRKLIAEAAKLEREKSLYPFVVIAGLVGSLGVVVGFLLNHFFH